MKLFLLFLCIGSVAIEASERTKATPAALFDVIHYDAQIQPDIARKTAAGKVLIRLIARIDNLATVEFDCGELTIDAVRERDVRLMAHELAHQWWGNRVTRRDWTHFWLNEGMATFMAAAYKERRFGREEYLREIGQYRTRYEKVRDVGKDRSLHFPHWLHPTPEDRALVYQKGAYVLHLLREELDEQLFWKGIRQYTRKYFGKSVTTADFQMAMEQATGKSLAEFFSKWVYLTER